MENSEVYGKFVVFMRVIFDFVVQICLAIKKTIKQTLLHNFKYN